jgi:hypothetical protein
VTIMIDTFFSTTSLTTCNKRKIADAWKSNSAFGTYNTAWLADICITSCIAGEGLIPGTATTDAFCSPCTSETFSSDNDNNACTSWSDTSCPPGTGYVPGSSSKDTACTPCTTGTYSASMDKSACVTHTVPPCTAGSPLIPGTTTADATCEGACAAGTFSTDGGACQPHSKSKCPRGYGYTTGSAYADSTCIACVGVTYSKDDDTGACLTHSDIMCGPGQGYAAGNATKVRKKRSVWAACYSIAIAYSSNLRICL